MQKDIFKSYLLLTVTCHLRHTNVKQKTELIFLKINYLPLAIITNLVKKKKELREHTLK
mgnify:CR=1 FL=1